MSKLVVIKIGEGSLDQGYPVTLQIGDEDATPNVSLDGKLPPSAEIPLTYGTWKSYFWQKLLLSPPARMKKRLEQATNYSDTALIESSNLLEQQLNGLLNDEVFRPLKEKFLEKINPDNVVRVIIQTDDPILRRRTPRYRHPHCQQLCPTQTTDSHRKKTTAKTPPGPNFP